VETFTQPDNAQVVSSKENERLSKYYRDLGLHFEMRFYDFMKKNY
jgi:hypothetical protein